MYGLKMVSPIDRMSWWSLKKCDLLIDGRFVSRIASLNTVIESDHCVCFEADDGASWLILSLGPDNSLFIEFVFSSLPGAINRWLPAVRRIRDTGAYDAVLFRAYGAGQRRLFRGFECVGGDLFRLS